MRNVYIILFCFFVGTSLTALFAPGIVSWYFDPPTSIGVSCREAVTWGINAYQKMILVGGIIGLIAGVVMAILFRKKRPAQPPVVPTV
jgi:hypothetical protein